MTPEQDARYRELIQELRCLVCQNQNIADSNAPLANDLRAQVQNQILAGRSDAEIKTYMTERYGDFVLYDPPVQGNTMLLWLAPALLLAVALALAVGFIRRSRRAAAAAPVADAAAVKKLLDNEP